MNKMIFLIGFMQIILLFSQTHIKLTFQIQKKKKNQLELE